MREGLVVASCGLYLPIAVFCQLTRPTAYAMARKSGVDSLGDCGGESGILTCEVT